jgi:hypothetical protein
MLALLFVLPLELVLVFEPIVLSLASLKILARE